MTTRKRAIRAQDNPATTGGHRPPFSRILRGVGIQALLFVTVALVPVWAHAAQITRVEAREMSNNSPDDKNDPIWEAASNDWQNIPEISTVKRDRCAFEVRYTQNICINRRLGGSTATEPGNADYRIWFDIDAGPLEQWTLYVTSARRGQVDVQNDKPIAGKEGHAYIGPISETHSSASSGEYYNVIGSLSTSLPYEASNEGDGDDDVHTPINDETAWAMVNGTGPATIWFQFGWQAYAKSLCGFANGGDQAALRLGKGTTLKWHAGEYPGNGDRTESTDGHFVYGYLTTSNPQVLAKASTCLFPLDPNSNDCTFHTIGTIDCVGENFDVLLEYYDGGGNFICDHLLHYTGVTNGAFEAWTTCQCPPGTIMDPKPYVVVTIIDTPGKSGKRNILTSGTFQVDEVDCQGFVTGDVNGDGVAFTKADLTRLVQFVNAGGPPPNRLYQGDLNGDGFIDQADIDAFNCYLVYGMSCFPVFPVPTHVNPDTVRGCCCGSSGCAIRSPANCQASGGEYQGDGTFCQPKICLDTVRALPGQPVALPVERVSGSLPYGGFDLLVTYDPSALTFVTATRGTLLDSLKWEYFTFRTGVNGNCNGGCPSGLVHLIAIADLDNGPQNHPIVSVVPGELAVVQFRVSSDRNLIGQCAPVRFYWNDCGDNTFSSVSGDTTYFDHWISDPLDNLRWDENDGVQFPESARPHGLGAPDSCLIGGGPGKPAPQRDIDFCNGWVCIRPPIDDRGDINQNGVANEIGDAVLFSNFFIYGIDQSFAPPGDQREAQKLATDVNDDGIVLTVADLVYLIRIITGDAQPFPKGENPKLTPYQRQAGAIVNMGADRVTVTANSSVDLGGAVFTFRYSGLNVGTPVLSDAASQMVVKSNAERGELRVLVAPMMNVKGARIGAGTNEILSIPTQGNGTIELVDVQMSDAEGNLLTTSASKSVPTEYTLLQNYPNPFNAGTIIQFGLKDATDWKLNVYNINGQTVRSFSGNGQGQVQVAWDGTDNHGRSIASGVYFYRLETKAFTATKKMTLMK